MSLLPELISAEFSLKAVKAGGVPAPCSKGGLPDMPAIVFVQGIGGQLKTFHCLRHPRTGARSAD